MAAGLTIWDASGNIVLDASYRIARIFDLRMLANGQNGSVTDAGLKQGAFVSFQPDSYIGYLSGGLIHPQFAFDLSTGTISWTYSAKNSATWDTYVNGYLYYGAY